MLEEKGDLAILVLEIRYLTETMKRLMILVLMVVSSAPLRSGGRR
jgi:hypothetical protein